MIIQQEKTFLQLTSENDKDEKCLGEIFERIGEEANLALHLSPLKEHLYFTVKIRLE